MLSKPRYQNGELRELCRELRVSPKLAGRWQKGTMIRITESYVVQAEKGLTYVYIVVCIESQATAHVHQSRIKAHTRPCLNGCSASVSGTPQLDQP